MAIAFSTAKFDAMQMSATYNDHESRYELTEDGHTAIANVRFDGEFLFIDYVESPFELRGKGTAGRLMQGIVDDAETKNLILRPVCGYAKKWLERYTNK